MTDESKVVDFRSRKGLLPRETRKAVEAAELTRDQSTRVPPPTDGLVLACRCGSTLHELLNAGVVRCSRCGDYGKAVWRFMQKPNPAPPTRGAPT